MLTHQTDTIIGEIPSDWTKVELRCLLSDAISGDWGDASGEVVSYTLRSTNFLGNGYLDYSNVAERYLPAEKAVKLAPKANDLLIERSGGGPTQPVGRVGIVEKDLPHHGFSNFVQLLRPNPEEVNPRYLGWVLHQLNSSGIVEKLQSQSTQMRNLDFRTYQRILVPKPPRPEQDKIVETVESAQKAIDATKKEIEATERLKRSLMQQLFTKGIPGRHKLFKSTKIGKIPQSWQVCRIRDLIDRTESGKSLLCESKPAEGNQWGILKVSAVSWDAFQPEENKLLPPEVEQNSDHLVHVGDIIMSRANTTELVGAVELVRYVTANLLLSDKTWRLILKPDINSEWFVMALKQKRIRNAIGARATGTSSSMKNVSQREFGNIKIAVPKESEQNEFDQIFTTLRTTLSSLHEELLANQRLKQSLLQNLLTGRVRVGAGVAA